MESPTENYRQIVILNVFWILCRLQNIRKDPGLTDSDWDSDQAALILHCVRWYCSYPLSYRQLTEMVNERGLDLHHAIIFRRLPNLVNYGRTSISIISLSKTIALLNY